MNSDVVEWLEVQRAEFHSWSVDLFFLFIANCPDSLLTKGANFCSTVLPKLPGVAWRELQENL